MNNLTYLIIISFVVGLVANLPRIDSRTLVFVIAAFVGGAVGLMLVFGDVPILIQYPAIFNEKVMPLLCAIGLVFIIRMVLRLHTRREE